MKDPLLSEANRRSKLIQPSLEKLAGETSDQTVPLTENENQSFRITKIDEMPHRERVNSETAAMLADKG